MARHRYSDFAERLDIDAFEEAIGFIPLSNNDGNDIGHCVFPENHFHGDTTGKFAIHREKRVYNCYVCDGGNLLSLVMEMYNWDSETAEDWLYQFAGPDKRSDEAFADYLLNLMEDEKVREKTVPYFNQRVLDRFDGPTDYFRERGISPWVINEFNLRYGEEVMKPAPSKERDGKRIKIDYNYIGPAAIFPHYWGGKLVGWQHRWMDWDKDHEHTPKWLAKYTNTSDFPKHNTLFGYDYVKKVKAMPASVIVVESVPTCLYLISLGFLAVSYFGDAPKEAQLRLLRKFQNGVMLAPDNDENGDRLLGCTEYLQKFVPVWHIDKVPGHGCDLNDLSSNEVDKYVAFATEVTLKV